MSGMNSNSLNSDKLLVNLVDSCNNYVNFQNRIATAMSNGLLQLALSRKPSNYCIRCSGDIRFELEPATLIAVRKTVDTDIPATGADKHRFRTLEVDEEFELKIKEQHGNVINEENDTVLLFCGLPPPPLKRCRNSFNTSVEDIVKMANVARHILKQVELHKSLDSNNQQGEE